MFSVKQVALCIVSESDALNIHSPGGWCLPLQQRGEENIYTPVNHSGCWAVRGKDLHSPLGAVN